MLQQRLIQNEGELLHAIQKETLRLLDQESSLLTVLEAAEISLGVDISKLRDVLENEREKVKNMTMTVAVVGTMKAGKSTLLNAIVGDEILPSRETGMTAMPLVISHDAIPSQPELHIKNVEALNSASTSFFAAINAIITNTGDTISGIFESIGERDAAFLRKYFIDGDGWHFSEVTRGATEIRETLQVMNDLLRLCRHKEVDTISPLEGIKTYADLPELRVNFSRFTAVQSQVSIGKLAFIDTPGPNEAAQHHLKEIVEEQLARASAIILVLNFTQLNTQADVDLQRQVSGLIEKYPEQIHIVVNRYDDKDHNGMSVEELKSYVTDSLFHTTEISQDRVLPVSAKQALLATRAITILNRGEPLPDPSIAPWVESFGNTLMGALWMEDISDISRVRRCAELGIKNSGFLDVTAGVVDHAFIHSASDSLRSALAKIRSFFASDSAIDIAIKISQGVLRADIEKLKDAAKQLEVFIKQLEQLHEETNCQIKESISRLSITINDEKNSLIGRLKFSEWADEGVEIHRKEEAPYWRRKAAELHELARKMVGKANEAKTKERSAIDGAIKEAICSLRDYIDAEREIFSECINEKLAYSQKDLEDTLNAKFSHLREKAEKLLKETFDVTLKFPKFSLHGELGDFDVASLGKEDTIWVKEKRSKRPWYYLWLKEVHYEVDVQQRIFRLDIKKLEVMLAKVVEELTVVAIEEFEKTTKKNIDTYCEQLKQKLTICRDALSQQKIDKLNNVKKKNERVKFLSNIEVSRSQIFREANECFLGMNSGFYGIYNENEKRSAR